MTTPITSPPAPGTALALTAPPSIPLVRAPRNVALTATSTSVETAYALRAERDNVAIPDAQLEAILALVALGRSEGLSLNELAARCDISAAALSKILSAKYEAALDGMVEKINAFLKLTRQRQSLSASAFVPTSVAKKIISVGEAAIVRSRIVFVTGDPQIGKSEALLELANRNGLGTRSYYALMPTGGSLPAFLRELGRVMGIYGRDAGDIREKIIAKRCDGKLLIIDEIHNCFHHGSRGRESARLDTLNFIRELWERTRCGIVLCGTNVFRDEVEEGRFRRDLEELSRRAFVKLQLSPVVPRRDLDLIAQSLGLAAADDDTHQLCLDIVRRHGLTGYVGYIQSAGVAAANRRQPVTWKHFTAAHDAFAKLSEWGEK